MKKKISKILTLILVLGAFTAIIFTLAIPGQDESPIIKLQYTTRNVLRPLEGTPFAGELLQVDQLCNIAIIAENYSSESYGRIGLSGYTITFIDSDGNRRYSGKRAIKYFYRGQVHSSNPAGDDMYETVFCMAFPRLTYYTATRKSSLNVGTFVVGAWEDGDIIINASISRYRQSANAPYLYEPHSEWIGYIEARIHVGEGAGVPLLKVHPLSNEEGKNVK